jgi:hypothetical protein
VAHPRGVKPIDRKADRHATGNRADLPVELECHDSYPRGVIPHCRYSRTWRPILLAMTAVMLGGTTPAFAVAVSPVLSPRKIPNHAGTGTLAWIPILSLIVATVAAFAAVALWWSTRRTRLDKKSKQLEVSRNDVREQARRIREAEDLVAAIATKINGIHTEISTMADIRDRAAIDPGRPLRLDPTAFALHRPLFDEYESHISRFRDDLGDLKRKLTQCQETVSSIVSAQWSILPAYVSYQLISIENSQRRLAADSGLVLNEASTIIAALLDSVLSLKDQMAGGASGADATKPP